MSKRGPWVFSTAIVALTVGIFALCLPVFIDAYDQYGWQVNCGSGFATDVTQASSADGQGHGANYVDQCDNALLIRRAWAIPAAAIGGITLVGLAAAVLAHDRRNTADEQSSARARESPG